MEPTDAIDIDGFDHWLDLLAQGITSPVPSDASHLAQAATWLHQKGQRTMVSSSFDRKLVGQLRPANADSASSSAPPDAVFPPRLRASRRATLSPWRRALLAAAFLLLAIPMMILAVRSFGSGGSDDPTITAPMNGLAQVGTPVPCSIQQPTTLEIVGTPEHEAILFATGNDFYPNIPGAGGPVLFENELPTGPPIPSDDLPEIQHMLASLAMCLYDRNYASIDAFLSDDMFRRDGANRDGGVLATPIPATDGRATPIDLRDYLMEPVTPVIVSHNVLADGRYGVLLDQDLTGFGLKQYFILVNSDRGWLIDESIYVSSRVDPSPEAASLTFAINAIDLQFLPSRIEIPADVNVTVIVTNDGMARKTFVVPELGVREELPVGESISVVVNAPKGVYEFYSDVPGQRAAGMSGFIIVLPQN